LISFGFEFWFARSFRGIKRESGAKPELFPQL